MSQLAYIQTNNKKYEPYNVVPTDGVKCIHCQVMVKPQQMQQHSLKHIDNRFRPLMTGINSMNTKNKTKPLNLKNILQQENKSTQTNEDLSIKSFLPDEVPSADTQRPHGYKNPGCSDMNNRTSIKAIASFPDNFSAFEQIPQDLEEQQERQCEIFDQPVNITRATVLNIQKNIDLKLQKAFRFQKKVNLYRNSNKQNNGFEDKHFQAQKQKKMKQSASADNILQYNLLVDKNPSAQQPSIMHVDFTKNTSRKLPLKNKQKISTLSTTGRSFFDRTVRNLNLGKSSVSYLTKDEGKTQLQSKRNYVNSDFQCQNCKGFYCRQCGSDIPPMYRPVPSARNHHSSRSQDNFDESIGEFYQRFKRNKQEDWSCSACQ